jgi:hypothetical protein
VVATGLKGWVRLSRGDTVIWHDHRLSPPPGSTPGPVGTFSVPIVLNGHTAVIAGTFFRVSRPSPWPWLGGGLVVLAALAFGARRRTFRARLTIGLGLLSGLAALLGVTTFAIRDSPTGGVAWLQVGTGLGLGALLGALLVRLRGRARVHAAGVIGAVGAAVSLSSLSIFWHGAVISALSGTVARLVCGLALLAGLAAAGFSFLPDFDEPRVRRRR